MSIENAKRRDLTKKFMVNYVVKTGNASDKKWLLECIEENTKEVNNPLPHGKEKILKTDISKVREEFIKHFQLIDLYKNPVSALYE